MLKIDGFVDTFRFLRPGGGLRAGVAAVLIAALAGCSVEPAPVLLGSEECAHCRMVISEPQFASQALTAKGKAFKFDAVECLAEWIVAGSAVPAESLHSTWVADFAEPDRWVPADEARFLRSDALRSPMGTGLAAFASPATAAEYRAELGGEILTWSQVLETVARDGGPGHAHHAAREPGR